MYVFRLQAHLIIEQLEESAQRLLEIIGSEPGMTCDTREHLGTDFLAIMEREHKMRPALPLKHAVRARLAFDLPTDSVEGGKNTPRP